MYTALPVSIFAPDLADKNTMISAVDMQRLTEGLLQFLRASKLS